MVDNREPFFLNSEAEIVQFETLEISHPNFSQTYRFIRNHGDGLTVTLEDALGDATFDYRPMEITDTSLADDLDFILEISLFDLGSILPAELEAVLIANGSDTKPTLIYRTYRSDDLTAPMWGPITLEVQKFAFNRQGATFEASTPRANKNRTGEIYTVDRFPMLRDFV